MTDRLDVVACRIATEESIDANGLSFGGFVYSILLDTQTTPSLAEYFRDLEARRELVHLVARADALNQLRDELVAMHRLEARRIPIERRIF